MTDYFEAFGWKVLEWYGVRFKHAPTLEPCAALALAVCFPNRPRCKPPSLAPSCRFRAAFLLMVLGDRLAGAEAVLLVVPFPQDVAVLLHLSWRPACCWRGAADNNDGGRGADLRKLGGYLLVPLLD